MRILLSRKLEYLNIEIENAFKIKSRQSSVAENPWISKVIGKKEKISVEKLAT